MPSSICVLTIQFYEIKPNKKKVYFIQFYLKVNNFFNKVYKK